MFKDETRSLRQACLAFGGVFIRQAGLGDTDSVFVGYGAPCHPEESMLKAAGHGAVSWVPGVPLCL